MKFGGVSQYFNSDGSVIECGTRKCSHCSKQVEIPNLRRMTDYMDFCRCCMRTICLECYGKPCTPELKRIEEAERRFHSRRQLMICLGLEK